MRDIFLASAIVGSILAYNSNQAKTSNEFEQSQFEACKNTIDTYIQENKLESEAISTKKFCNSYLDQKFPL